MNIKMHTTRLIWMASGIKAGFLLITLRKNKAETTYQRKDKPAVDYKSRVDGLHLNQRIVKNYKI